MNVEKWGKVATIILSAVLAVVAVLTGVVIRPEVPSAPPVVIGAGGGSAQALTERINLDSMGDNQISNGGDLIFWSGFRTSEKARLDGATGTFSHAGFDIDTPSTAISVTNNATITPTASYQPLSSAGTVTASLSTSGIVTGAVLMLVNTTNTTIILTDTGTLKASGNVSLGQYDAAQFSFDGTNWIQTGESDN